MTEREFELLKVLLDKGFLGALALFGGFWLKRWQEDRTALLHKQQEDQTALLKRQEEERLAILQRQFVPRIEYDLRCDFYGPEAGDFLVAISLRVANKGNMRRTFISIHIRLRGIAAGTQLRYWEGQQARVEFPLSLMNHEFVPGGPNGGNYYYVEPEISQVFTYVTKIPADTRYVLAQAKCMSRPEEYEQPDEYVFTEERLFPVRSASLPASEPVQA